MNNPMMMLMQFMNSNKNPQEVVQQLIQKNPNMQILINQMKQSGMSPKEYTRQYLTQNGFDFSQVEKMVNNRGIK